MYDSNSYHTFHVFHTGVVLFLTSWKAMERRVMIETQTFGLANYINAT